MQDEAQVIRVGIQHICEAGRTKNLPCSGDSAVQLLPF